MQEKNLNLKKWVVGPTPIIDAVLEALEFSSIVGRFVKNERYVRALTVLVKNILIAPAALYRIPQWASAYEPESMGGGELKDDSIGRALEKLFACDRATLQTQPTLKTIATYQVDTT